MTPTRKQLILVVTQGDINHGVRCSSARCPIANSLRRRFGLSALRVTVTYENIQAGPRAFFTTSKMEQWMAEFDKGNRVKPTAFFVDTEA